MRQIIAARRCPAQSVHGRTLSMNGSALTCLALSLFFTRHSLPSPPLSPTSIRHSLPSPTPSPPPSIPPLPFSSFPGDITLEGLPPLPNQDGSHHLAALITLDIGHMIGGLTNRRSRFVMTCILLFFCFQFLRY